MIDRSFKNISALTARGLKTALLITSALCFTQTAQAQSTTKPPESYTDLNKDSFRPDYVTANKNRQEELLLWQTRVRTLIDLTISNSHKYRDFSPTFANTFEHALFLRMAVSDEDVHADITQMAEHFKRLAVNQDPERIRKIEEIFEIETTYNADPSFDAITALEKYITDPDWIVSITAHSIYSDYSINILNVTPNTTLTKYLIPPSNDPLYNIAQTTHYRLVGNIHDMSYDYEGAYPNLLARIHHADNAGIHHYSISSVLNLISSLVQEYGDDAFIGEFERLFDADFGASYNDIIHFVYPVYFTALPTEETYKVYEKIFADPSQIPIYRQAAALELLQRAISEDNREDVKRYLASQELFYDIRTSYRMIEATNEANLYLGKIDKKTYNAIKRTGYKHLQRRSRRLSGLTYNPDNPDGSFVFRNGRVENIKPQNLIVDPLDDRTKTLSPEHSHQLSKILDRLPSVNTYAKNHSDLAILIADAYNDADLQNLSNLIDTNSNETFFNPLLGDLTNARKISAAEAIFMRSKPELQYSSFTYPTPADVNISDAYRGLYDLNLAIRAQDTQKSWLHLYALRDQASSRPKTEQENLLFDLNLAEFELLTHEHNIPDALRILDQSIQQAVNLNRKINVAEIYKSLTVIFLETNHHNDALRILEHWDTSSTFPSPFALTLKHRAKTGKNPILKNMNLLNDALAQTDNPTLKALIRRDILRFHNLHSDAGTIKTAKQDLIFALQKTQSNTLYQYVLPDILEATFKLNDAANAPDTKISHTDYIEASNSVITNQRNHLADLTNARINAQRLTLQTNTQKLLKTEQQLQNTIKTQKRYGLGALLLFLISSIVLTTSSYIFVKAKRAQSMLIRQQTKANRGFKGSYHSTRRMAGRMKKHLQKIEISTADPGVINVINDINDEIGDFQNEIALIAQHARVSLVLNDPIVKHINMSQFLTASSHYWKEQVDQNTVILEFIYDSSFPNIMSDEHHISAMIAEILAQSIERTEQGQIRMTIMMSDNNTQLIINCHDTGRSPRSTKDEYPVTIQTTQILNGTVSFPEKPTHYHNEMQLSVPVTRSAEQPRKPIDESNVVRLK